MSLNRELVYSRLWTLITTASGIVGEFKTAKRLLRHIEDVDPNVMPALFMLQQGESWVRKGKGIPSIRTLNAALFFYIATTDGSNVLPATLMNNAMDTIDALFNTPAGKVETLGGLVEHVYVAEGEVRFYEGLLQDKSPVVIPLRILVP
jgi:hypothetical protein